MCLLVTARSYNCPTFSRGYMCSAAKSTRVILALFQLLYSKLLVQDPLLEDNELRHLRCISVLSFDRYFTITIRCRKRAEQYHEYKSEVIQ